MDYVFVFLGEFGYELFNWQGVIRKFSRTISESDRIICCSRSQVYPLYETADHYVEILSVPAYRRSQASCYYGVVPGDDGNLRSKQNLDLDRKIRKQIQNYLRKQDFMRQSSLLASSVRYVYSSERQEINDCDFGADRAAILTQGNIYENLDLSNNVYSKINPVLSAKADLEQRIGFSLSEPYILVQSRARDVVIRSVDLIPKERLLEALLEASKVIFLGFKTGREFDSYSQMQRGGRCHYIECSSFIEQSCLIYFARKCLFFTEGDFGSHIYVPPFMGKDVVAVAPQSVYSLGTTPIEFWNHNVFRFGGAIIPKISEEVFASNRDMYTVVDELFTR